MTESPGYRDIADGIAAGIDDGTIPVGQPLLSRREIQDRHGVSDGTAQRVLDDLAKRGYAATRAGRRAVAARPGMPEPEPVVTVTVGLPASTVAQVAQVAAGTGTSFDAAVDALIVAGLRRA